MIKVRNILHQLWDSEKIHFSPREDEKYFTITSPGFKEILQLVQDFITGITSLS